MEIGTVSNLIQLVQDEGKEYVRDYLNTKIVALEDLIECGFSEAIPALNSLQNCYKKLSQFKYI